MQRKLSGVLTFPDPRALVLSIRASAFVFEDPASQALLDRIRRVAPSEANILIRGEPRPARNQA